MNRNLFICCLCIFFLGCSTAPKDYELLKIDPPIIPDYIGVTIPVNIAPLYFYLDDFGEQVEVTFNVKGVDLQVYTGKRSVEIDPEKWRKLLEEAYTRKEPINVQVAKCFRGKWLKYNSFTWQVAEPIDPFIAYRLIEPGYESWDFMGIYQRDLTSFEETPIMVNNLSDRSCMNCHSFQNYRSDHFVFHTRGSIGATVLVDKEKLTKLDTKTAETLSTFTYPAWHPGGRFVAFSTNKTGQFFHASPEKQIEVYDMDSDIVIYDTEQNVVIKSSQLMDKDYFESYPTWSPDGSVLYFCRADSLVMPDVYEQVKYNICQIGFDAATGKLTTAVDTFFHVADSSAVFPRVSPDGRFLLYTQLHYGCFPIWHKEADLKMIRIADKQKMVLNLNSNETDSYHAWSSNNRWIMFSSRREDGLFTRLYFSYIDEEGNTHKPFLLPQKTFEINNPLLKSYNVPEFIADKVKISPYAIEKCLKGETLSVQIKKEKNE